MIKMVALDLDGTLLEPSGMIAQTTLEQLAKISEGGCKIAIATGRPYIRTLDPLKKNHLYPQGSFPQFLICEERDVYGLGEHGYVAWESNQATLEEERSHLSLSHRLLSQLEKIAPTLEFAINNAYSQTSRGFVETYFVYPHEALEAFEVLTDLAVGTPLKVTRNSRNVCLRSRKVGKGLTLKRVANYCSLGLSEVLAVGDSHNDLEMLISGVVSATTNNADEMIKEVVRQTGGLISSLDHSLGVGQIIQRVVGTGE